MRQIYENYTQEDQDVWRMLYQRQHKDLPGMASRAFLEGLEVIRFSPERIPSFDETNEILRKATGWQLVVVPGLVPDYTFFELMSHRCFPATTWLRKLKELDYLQEPDMFHDVFAHVPLLTCQPFVDFLENLAKIGLMCCGNAEAIEYLARVYWFTVEFGLIKEDDKLKIYGAGILSSSGECHFSISHKVPTHTFGIAKVMEQGFYKDKYQDRYYVIDNYEALYAAIPEIKRTICQRSNLAVA